MPVLLRQSPFYDRVTTVDVRGRPYRILPYQILVWLSVGPAGVLALDPQTPRFPAVLDTAFTDNFLIHRDQLRDWAGYQPDHFRRFNANLQTHGRQIPLHAANLWIHPNVAGQRDQFTAVSPFLVELHRGIGICTDSDLYPRLPLLGARALRQAQLQRFIDYRQCQVSLRTRRRFWLFG